ncbi:MAG: GNAT family N-acetyltransferase [Prolixibacteraceae bacterium]
MEKRDDPEFTKLGFDGLKTLVGWARDEGWNPGLHDADVFWGTDPDGFYGYYENGELVAGGSVVCYSGKFGFMGFFIVRPDLRGTGIGRRLWFQRRDKLLSRLQEGAPIGMDGVVAMQPFYQKGGFQLAFRDERHERTGQPFLLHPFVLPVKEQDMDQVVEYDSRCFGFSRPQFMQQWLNLADASAFKYQADGKVRGLAVIRKAAAGHRIGPLFADSRNIAEELYKACLDAAPGEQVFIDIPVINSDAVALVQKYGTNCCFECGRMYYGKAPVMTVDKIFGITSLELG